MRCISPLSIRRPEGKSNADRITVPCGKCLACLSRKRADWAFRLHQEWKKSDTALFVTLTYNEESIPFINKESGEIYDSDSDERIHIGDIGNLGCTVWKKDVQDFIREVRRRYEGYKIRYFISSEYGPETKRPHYHGLIFNIPFELYKGRHRKEDFFEWSRLELEHIWKKGFVTSTQVTEERIGYTAKYCITKSEELTGVMKVFSLMSRRPGIGSGYLSSDIIKWHKADGNYRNFIDDQGFKRAIPRYYKEKIFDDREKELIKADYEVIMSRNDMKEEFDGLRDLEIKKQFIERVKNQVIKKGKL